jgi:hypothetical protein
VVADGADVDAEHLGHAPLVEPERLGLVQHLDVHGVIGGAVEDELAFLGRLVGHASGASSWPVTAAAIRDCHQIIEADVRQE